MSKAASPKKSSAAPSLAVTGVTETITVSKSTVILLDNAGKLTSGAVSDIAVGDILIVTMSGDAVKTITVGRFGAFASPDGLSGATAPSGSQSGSVSASDGVSGATAPSGGSTDAVSGATAPSGGTSDAVSGATSSSEDSEESKDREDEARPSPKQTAAASPSPKQNSEHEDEEDEEDDD